MIRKDLFNMIFTRHLSIVRKMRFEFSFTNITKRDGLLVLLLKFITLRIYVIMKSFRAITRNLTNVAISILFRDTCLVCIRPPIFVQQGL